jgi:post-segregation antitoxin (ccd killing protein)
MRMSNRTVYLPEDLDSLSRHFELNLSKLTQEAIKRVAAEREDETLAARVKAASDRIRRLDIDWPTQSLDEQRAQAGER